MKFRANKGLTALLGEAASQKIERASCGFGVPKSFGISEIIQLTILRPLNSKTYDARFAHLGSKLDSFQITQVPLWTGRGIYLYPNDRKLHTISPKQFAQPYNGG